VAASHQLGQKGLLNASLQNGDTHASQVFERLDIQVGLGIHLRPAVGHRHLVKIKTLGALGGKGHIGHQVELPLLQLFEAACPLAGDVAHLPVLGTRHLIQQLDEQAGRPAFCIGINFGGVFVETYRYDPSLVL